MALSAEQKIAVSKILGVTPIELEAQIIWLGARLTEAIEASILTDIDRWELAGSEFDKIEPRAENFGYDNDPDREKADIRKNIAVLLERPEWASGQGSAAASAGGDMFYIERG
ncbi:MAG: hypothetical protein AB7P97_21560 [Hyphomonadaceae bacterium]